MRLVQMPRCQARNPLILRADSETSYCIGLRKRWSCRIAGCCLQLVVSLSVLSMHGCAFGTCLQLICE